MSLPVCLTITANGGHMSSGGFRSKSLSTEAKTTIKVLRLVNLQTPPLLICRVVWRFLFL